MTKLGSTVSKELGHVKLNAAQLGEVYGLLYLTESIPALLTLFLAREFRISYFETERKL